MWTDAQLENWRLRQRHELSRPSYGAVTTPPSTGPCPDIIRVKRKRGPVLSNEPVPEDSVDDLWR